MARPKEAGYYYFDGKEFSQPKLLWRSKNIAELLTYIAELLAARRSFRLVIDPNAAESLAVRPDAIAKSAVADDGGMTTNWLETCPPLPPEECDQ